MGRKAAKYFEVRGHRTGGRGRDNINIKRQADAELSSSMYETTLEKLIEKLKDASL